MTNQSESSVLQHMTFEITNCDFKFKKHLHQY